MVSAVGASPLYSSNISAPSSAGLDVQLDQYKIKLADWQNCASCNTAEGKAKIAEISDKISEIKARMEAVDAAKRNHLTTVSDVNSVADKNGATTRAENDDKSAAPLSTTSTLGSRLDVFA